MTSTVGEDEVSDEKDYYLVQAGAHDQRLRRFTHNALRSRHYLRFSIKVFFSI